MIRIIHKFLSFIVFFVQLHCYFEETFLAKPEKNKKAKYQLFDETIIDACAVLRIEEHDLDNNACGALWLVQEHLFTCMCTLNCACVQTWLHARQYLRIHEILSIKKSQNFKQVAIDAKFVSFVKMSVIKNLTNFDLAAQSAYIIQNAEMPVYRKLPDFRIFFPVQKIRKVSFFLGNFRAYHEILTISDWHLWKWLLLISALFSAVCWLYWLKVRDLRLGIRKISTLYLPEKGLFSIIHHVCLNRLVTANHRLDTQRPSTLSWE